MAKTDKSKRLKSSLKNTKAKLKRREDRIAELEAKIADMETESQKKAETDVMDQALKSITREYQGISSRNSSSDTPSCSDAKQMQALEMLSRLLKDWQN
ncbi:MAG: hypothetical protein IJV33_05900 [Bacteroidaceae bacterium]|nr:hypothetical protein [Bacteroidaceae bacterium]